MNYFPLHFSIAIWLLILNIKNETWRYIKVYLLNMLYVVSFNGVYYILCYNYLLWDFRAKLFKTSTIRYLQVLGINSLITLLYLSKLPSSLLAQIIYLFKWIISALLVESVAKYFGFIQFFNGWHLGWSALVYIQMFIYSQLFNKKPIKTLLLSLLSTIFFIIKFKVPVKKSVNFKILKKHLTDKTNLLFVVLYLIAFIIAVKKRK